MNEFKIGDRVVYTGFNTVHLRGQHGVYRGPSINPAGLAIIDFDVGHEKLVNPSNLSLEDENL